MSKNTMAIIIFFAGILIGTFSAPFFRYPNKNLIIAIPLLLAGFGLLLVSMNAGHEADNDEATKKGFWKKTPLTPEQQRRIDKQIAYLKKTKSNDT